MSPDNADEVQRAAAWPAPSSRRCARMLTMPVDELAASEGTFLTHLVTIVPNLPVWVHWQPASRPLFATRQTRRMDRRSRLGWPVRKEPCLMHSCAVSSATMVQCWPLLPNLGVQGPSKVRLTGSSC